MLYRNHMHSLFTIMEQTVCNMPWRLELVIGVPKHLVVSWLMSAFAAVAVLQVNAVLPPVDWQPSNLLRVSAATATSTGASQQQQPATSFAMMLLRGNGLRPNKHSPREQGRSH
jgi:hypothetical protein